MSLFVSEEEEEEKEEEEEDDHEELHWTVWVRLVCKRFGLFLTII